MEWTDDDRKALLAFKNNIDCDEIKIKEQIKQVLLNNRFIVHVLNNKKLEETDAEPDDYFGDNIRSYFMIPETQSETRNFLCFTVGFKELDRYNSTVKILQLEFHILCHQQDIIDEDTGVPRHDLLAALVQDEFNYTTKLGGGRLELVSSTESTTDNNYATRTLVFMQRTDNNLVKTRIGTPYIINKEFQEHV